jgi:hypothetical protein
MLSKRLIRTALIVLVALVASGAFASYREGEIIVKYRQSSRVVAASAVSAAIPGASVKEPTDAIRMNHILHLCLEPDDVDIFVCLAGRTEGPQNS